MKLNSGALSRGKPLALVSGVVLLYWLLLYGGMLGPVARQWLPYAAWVLLATAAGIRSLITARRANARHLRIAWYCFAAAGLLWGVGIVVLVAGQLVISGFATYASPANYLFLSYGALFIAGLFFMGAGATHASVSLIRLSNIALITWLTLLCAVLILLEPMRQSAEKPAYVLYAISDLGFFLAATIVAITYLWTDVLPRMRPVIVLLALSVGVHLASNLAYYYLTFAEGTSGIHIDFLWLVALSFHYWSAVKFDTESVRSPAAMALGRKPVAAVLQAILPAALLLGALALAVVFRANLTPEAGIVAIPLFALFAISLGVREWASQKHETHLAQDLHDSDALKSHVLQVSPTVVFICEARRGYPPTYISENVKRILGLEREQFSLRRQVYPEDSSVLRRAFEQVSAHGRANDEFRMLDGDGKYRWLDLKMDLAQEPGTKHPEIVGTVTDITQKKALQISMEQNQRLEALGRFSGSIAHDFNNLLTTILGYASLLVDSDQLDEQQKKSIREIHSAGERGAGLTSQLLAFSHRHAFEVEAIDLNAMLMKMSGMLDRLMGDKLTIAYRIANQPLYVDANLSQMEQVVMNLVVNARDALADGGKIVIEVTAAEKNQLPENAAESREHPFVLLSVCDTGKGIEKDILNKIFDPFYTTKSSGTGLGLATVQHIVSQHAGHISVHSEPGKGTQFLIFLPAARLEPKTAPMAPGRMDAGTECILVVDDDPAITGVIASMLVPLGYRVLTANDAEAAIHLARQNEFDLLLTDIVMPVCNGRELMLRLQDIRKNFRAIFMSGYTDDIITRQRAADCGAPLLQKPLTANLVGAAIRTELDRRPGIKNVQESA